MPVTAGSNGKASSYNLWSLVFLRPLSSIVEIYFGTLKTIIPVMRKCNSLFCAAKGNSDCSLWAKYKIVRNKDVALLRCSKTLSLLLVRGFRKPFNW